jgi:hypothetical protein
MNAPVCLIVSVRTAPICVCTSVKNTPYV